jgi:hypothetical protein
MDRKTCPHSPTLARDGYRAGAAAAVRDGTLQASGGQACISIAKWCFAVFPALTTQKAWTTAYRLYHSEHPGVPYGTNPAVLHGNYRDSLAFLFGAWIAQTGA